MKEALERQSVYACAVCTHHHYVQAGGGRSCLRRPAEILTGNKIELFDLEAIANSSEHMKMLSYMKIRLCLERLVQHQEVHGPRHFPLLRVRLRAHFHKAVAPVHGQNVVAHVDHFYLKVLAIIRAR